MVLCLKGKSLWTISLPAAITALEVMDHKARGFKAGVCVCVCVCVCVFDVVHVKS